MIAIFISLFTVVLSFNFFMMSYQINGINRLVLNTPLSLFETAINFYEINKDVGPYFIKEELEDNITYYFDFHMPKYVEEYDLHFYYYHIEDHSIDMSDQPRAVDVTISTTVTMYTHYEKTMFYEIRSNR